MPQTDSPLTSSLRAEDYSLGVWQAGTIAKRWLVLKRLRACNPHETPALADRVGGPSEAVHFGGLCAGERGCVLTQCPAGGMQTRTGCLLTFPTLKEDVYECLSGAQTKTKATPRT